MKGAGGHTHSSWGKSPGPRFLMTALRNAYVYKGIYVAIVEANTRLTMIRLLEHKM